MAKVKAEKKPTCKLVGEDGNAFSVISRVSKALKDAGYRDKATEFQDKAFASPSYDALLALCLEYVDAC